ncbi:ABC transporter substrate-binding protein [uncultured Clostridium sp.]|uniref:ABC transporter substrate-binding protein n=1 Tax=uncultured Clostridium sp. TaxID=59620 RepID=UPI0025F6D421|nr:ABC transporter substrate-binding protein [uncultured Clostridium sp.]
MSKKILSLMISCLMLFTLISCGKVEETNKDEVTISFSWWGDENRYDKTMEAIKLFESKYPNIKVKEQFGEWAGFKKRMNMKIAGNDEPDLMQINYDWLENYSKDGKGFYNLNYTQDDIRELLNFYKTLLDQKVFVASEVATNENKDNVTDILLSPYYENSLIKEICQEVIKEIALGKSTPEACAATTYDQLLKTLNTIKVK